jgi:hypothetical protein
MINEKYLQKFYDRKNCIICNKTFFRKRSSKSRSRIKMAGVRRAISRTCSNKCSRVVIKKRQSGEL